MALMQWSEHFVTGLDLIDTQHKKLVDLINAVAPQLAEVGESPVRNVRPLLDQLAEYAVLHFACEEGLMEKHGIDAGYFSQHQHTHSLFAQEVAQLIQGISTDNNVSGTDLLRFLTSWLSFHILSEDQNMARQLRAIQAGSSPESARGAVSSENTSANTVLVGALTDLFGLISQRNKTLINLNKELNQAKAGLAQANQQLEVRVLERTRQLQQAQSQLLQSEKMAAVGQLAAGIAHEINNPIGFINSNFSTLSGYTVRLFALLDAYENLEMMLPAEHPAHSAMTKARELAELDFLRQDIPDLLRESGEGLARVKRIVGDLKDFSHVDESEWQKSDINQELESTLNRLSSLFQNRIKVICDFAAVPSIDCIPAQLDQVFMNLLVNATQAIEGSGVITIETRFANQQVQIVFSDTGHGIPDEIKKRIFEPFFTNQPVGKGTGLGLSAVWEIIQRHGGQIEVESTPGTGSTFTIVLPLNSSQASVDAGTKS